MLEYAQTNATPYVLVDEDKGYMYFRGESFHENVLEFYQTIMDWLREYLKSDFNQLTFDCELKYFNSSTAKMLLNILLMMDKAANERNQVVVNWITTEDNEINIECGEDFAEEFSKLVFNLVIR